MTEIQKGEISIYILAINGSPHTESGNTALILNPFLEGMKEAGAEVELVYTRRLKIEPCSGDMGCWMEHPGKCGVKDDMEALLPKIARADVLVWATPVYYSGITGPLKNVMDRQLPIFASGGGAVGQGKKAVLVSTCGDWKLEMFDPLLAQMRALYGMPETNSEFAGALLRPHAEVMKEMIKAGETRMVDAVFRAAREAGRQLIRDGRMADDTLRAVSAALMPQDAYNKAAMESLQQIQEAARKREDECK